MIRSDHVAQGLCFAMFGLLLIHGWSEPFSLITLPMGLVAALLIRPEKSVPIGPIPYRNALLRFSVAAILVVFGILAVLPDPPDSLDWVFPIYGLSIRMPIRTEMQFGQS